jgi:hypothetical protein
MAPPAILKGRIRQAILTHGPMTYEELTQHLPDKNVDRIKWCIQEDRRKKDKRIFRVADWKRNYDIRGLPSPIIGIGSEPDAEAPIFTNRLLEANKRYNKKRAAKKKEEAVRATFNAAVEARAASVFASFVTPTIPVVIKSVPARIYRT